MNKGEFHARLWSKLSAFDKAQALFEPGDKVLAAVSGGPDSVCLAHYLSRLTARRRIEVRLVHLHHGLRGREADRDADSVRRLGDALGLPVTLKKIPVIAVARTEHRCLEDAGRKLRYRALLREARARGFNKVATGHQLDDQAETVLLNLLRGTKAEGLAGIPPRRPLGGGVEVVRPLLCLSRKEVEAYLGYHRLKARQDRSNRELRFTRNWVRWKVLPLLESRSPKLREHLAAIARSLGRPPRGHESGSVSTHLRMSPKP